ncbi:MAG: hypothetical protein J5614_08230 [Paludibacteraceae bacterium]|nr:hypothetical protein [Paludibacteraceae bacterium]
MRNDSIKWIAIVLVILILGVAVAAALTQGFTNANPYGWLDKKQAEPEEPADEEEEVEPQMRISLLSVSDFQEYGILLEEAEAVTSADGGDTAFEKTLTATVLPADATDKSVDWSIAWSQSASRASQNVNTYVTITPTANGSNVAKVKCLKAFTGDNIFVTVTTRSGVFSASCMLSYEGIPQTLAIDTSGKTIKTDSSWNKSMVELDCNGTYTFNLNLDNDLHAVGSNYGQYTVSVVPYGAINTTIVIHSNSTGQDTTSTATYQHKIATSYETNGNVITALGTNDALVYANVYVENGQLVVVTGKSPSAFSAITGNQGGYKKENFSGYVDNKPCYIAITVTDTVSGLSKSINVKTIATVSSVSLNNMYITF